ncbi:MAG: SurA N-terminal domain-containing protein [Chitinophagaceae bacterium]|nr:SurA N-terminal domain-containing protein [Chitinophagaceae bacterium]
MSVIQQIQEKYAKVMAVIIALALVIFVVMLAFENGGSLFNDRGPQPVGKVNGEEVGYNEFKEAVDATEEQFKQQYQTDVSNPAMTQKAVSQAWSQVVVMKLLNEEIKKVGLEVSQAELGDYLYGANPPQMLAQAFTDPNTGLYDAQLAQENIRQMLASSDVEQRNRVVASLEGLENERLYQKYISLLVNSYNVPKWLVEKQKADDAKIASISVVKEFYSNVPVDSASNVTDKEIADYIAKHKDEFKQEASRTISYVAFSALPTADDTAATLRSIVELKPEFDSTLDAASVLNRNGSAIPYTEIYFPKSQLNSANLAMGVGFKDSILLLPKNGVYGPYLDGDAYVMAKLLDSKVLPDSVKCRHVLISNNPQQGGFEDGEAKRKIDSVEAAIRGGASFAAMVQQYNPESDGSRVTNGEMTFASTQIQSENFAPEFGQFILFDGKPGDRKVVKTSFGYHYIEILSFIKPETHYQIAYMAKKIEASGETDNNASNQASVFAAAVKDMKSFDAEVEKLRPEGINKLTASLPVNGAQLVGVGFSRPFVRKVYEADRGDIVGPERVGESYVVAIVADVLNEGTMSPATARPRVEPLLINHKKAQSIARKIGTITTLEAAATALGGRNIESFDSLRLTGVRPAGLTRESRVIGAAFNPAYNGKVVPEVIEGAEGVYVVRVDSQSVTSNTEGSIDEMRKTQIQYGRNTFASPQVALRKAATIKDDTAKHF